MALVVGDHLGPYEIRGPLGAGGMGEVFRARDTRLNRDVAVKTLRSDVAADADRVGRFEREARAASALNHPNIITIYDVGEQAGTLYIAMELVDGTTLRGLLSTGERPPVRKTLDLAAQIADGLACAHTAGLVHRDLKPENVMVSRDGFVKILDFGLVKLAAASDELNAIGPTIAPHATRAGIVLGTVSYMSPEQASGRPLDYRSDQFALGMILYEMATGRRAFERPTAAETLSAIIREDPDPAALADSKTPVPLRWIIERCLAKDPEDRYVSTRDLARDLKSLRDHLSETATSGEVVARPTASNRRRVLLQTAAVAVVALGVGALLTPRAMPRPGRVIRSTLLMPENVAFGLIAVSPDGTRVAFTGTDTSGNSRLWIRGLDAFDAQVLPGTDGATLPFWSADSRSIGFFTPGGKLKKVDASGGPVVSLWDVDGAGGAWNRDGDIIFAATTGSILRIKASGGPATPVTTLNQGRHETSHRYPYFLPDGRRFLYLAMNLAASPADAANQIRVGSLDSPEDRPLVHAYSNAAYSQGYLVFMRGGSRAGGLIAQAFDPDRLELRGEPVTIAERVSAYDVYTAFGSFSLSDTGVLVYDSSLLMSRLVWFDRTGRQLGSFGDAAEVSDARISPDGQRVAYSLFEPAAGTMEVWVGDLARGIATRLTNGPSQNFRPVWSPDGSRIAFASDRARQQSVYVRSSTGGGRDEPLWETEGQSGADDWSPDARSILMFQMTSSGSRMPSLDVLTMPEQKATRLVQAQVRGNFFGDSRFSPDGHWVAYENDDSGRVEVYATSFPRGDVTLQISNGGGMYPTWRRDGRELFYLGLDSKFMSVEMVPGSTLKAGVPKPLFQMPIPTSYTFSGRYDVSPDGQRFLVSVPILNGNSVPLNLVVNWTAGVKP